MNEAEFTKEEIIALVSASEVVIKLANSSQMQRQEFIDLVSAHEKVRDLMERMVK